MGPEKPQNWISKHSLVPKSQHEEMKHRGKVYRWCVKPSKGNGLLYMGKSKPVGSLPCEQVENVDLGTGSPRVTGDKARPPPWATAPEPQPHLPVLAGPALQQQVTGGWRLCVRHCAGYWVRGSNKGHSSFP